MSKKVLFCATVKSHIAHFHIPYLKLFKEQGFEVHVAAKDNSSEINIEIDCIDSFFDIPFERSPLRKDNLIAYKKLKIIIADNEYSIIHCHTPVAGVITRLAAKNIPKNKAKIIYTAHGFHFFKGAPLLNWIIYYPIEKWLSKYTDCLITINEEDYNTAKTHGFKAQSIVLVNGVGIDLSKFSPVTDTEKKKLRKEYGYDENAFILIYAAELTYRKHQDLVIHAVNTLKHKIPKIKLLIAGVGNLEEQYKSLVQKLCLSDYVDFLGFRRDISNLMKLSDVAVSSSRQEGLPVNIMEAMASGLPVVATNCRGNRDLITDNENGFIVELDDVNGFANCILKLYASENTRRKFGEKSIELVNKYSIEQVMANMKNIYFT